MSELMKGISVGKILGKKEERNTLRIICICLAVVAGIAAIAGIAYGIYRYVNRDFYDFDDDFDDLFDDDEDEDFED